MVKQGHVCNTKDTHLAKKLHQNAASIGVDLIVKQMKLTSLKAIAEGVEIEDLKKQPYTRATLTHYLPEYITDNLDSYFAEAKSSVIHEFLQVLDADPVSKNHEELVQQVIELINWTGVHAFLTRFDVSFLKEIMEDLDLDCGSDNKANIVMAIVNGTDAEPGKAVRKQVAPSKKKPKMKAGITKEDLQQYLQGRDGRILRGKGTDQVWQEERDHQEDRGLPQWRQGEYHGSSQQDQGVRREGCQG